MNITIEKIKYPDGSFYSKVYSKNVNPENYPVKVDFRINSYDDLWQLAQIKDAMDAQGIKGRLYISCLLDAQADRRFNPNESHNLKLVCKFINDMQWESVTIFHPHNPEVVEALIDNVTIIDNAWFVSRVLFELANVGGGVIDEKINDRLVIMFPDAGAFKWGMKLVNQMKWDGEVEVASKSRKWESSTEKSILTQNIERQDFGGKDVLIIDDLMVRGGTFLGLANLLKTRNVGNLYLAVSHITIPDPNPEIYKAFKEVFTTDSKGLSYGNYDGLDLKIPSNLTILKGY
jgi:ribose-phosphate pyrophosphokinase